jgi:nicotinamidase-related amidase
MTITTIKVDFHFNFAAPGVVVDNDSLWEVTLIKSASNAFASTDGQLKKFLDKKNIRHIVVMGYHVNSCVMATIGSDTWLVGGEGAIQLGYTVFTCEEVLRGGGGATSMDESTTPGDRWKFDNPALRFFSYL